MFYRGFCLNYLFDFLTFVLLNVLL
ncbi:MAG: hypothetical protein RIS63_1156, partial [Bacteroidota bacterium]